LGLVGHRLDDYELVERLEGEVDSGLIDHGLNDTCLVAQIRCGHARFSPSTRTRRHSVRRIALAAAALAVFAATAVAASAQTQAIPTKKPSKLVVGFDLPAPGFWNGQASGTTIKHPTGFEHSLALAIASQLKIKAANVQFLRAPFSTILLAGKKPYDFALEETTITAQRARVVSFSSSYFN